MVQEIKVGFIGLGDQGAPIARRIVEAGYDTTLWARRPESLAPFADTAAHRTDSLAELGARCAVVGVCVRTDADVDQVVRGAGGLLGAMRPGSIILIHSTVHPDLCRQLAAAGEQAAVAVLDAPVSGGNARAATGQMAVMVGGARAAFETVRPLLQTFASTVEWLGPIGSGQLCKLVNNALFMVNFSGALALLETGEGLGLERQALARMLAAASAQSFALGMAATISPAGVRQGEALLRKDVGLLLDVLQERGHPNGYAATLARSAVDALKDITTRQEEAR